MRISFNQAPYREQSMAYIRDAIEKHRICGDGKYNQACALWLEQRTGTARALLTTSCTHSLEMAAMLCGIGEGDEVIMPSFTFVSTADAFVIRGATAVFVDIRPDTMNINEALLEEAVTDRTKAIVPVHYGGVGCEMDVILDIARRHNLYVIEDAAQGMMSAYKGQPLGAIGDFGAYSFHETKNYSMGEGGAILIRNKENILNAEIIREKGTNRSQFFRGQVDKYTWQAPGSSYLPSELNAAYLLGQLEDAEAINRHRLDIWMAYYERLLPLSTKGLIALPYIPDHCSHNAHIFYLKCKDLEERTRLLSYLQSFEIGAVFHYVPLHSSKAGKRYGRFNGEDRFTTRESERLVRLPMYETLREEQIEYVTEKIFEFYEKNRT